MDQKELSLSATGRLVKQSLGVLEDVESDINETLVDRSAELPTVKEHETPATNPSIDDESVGTGYDTSATSIVEPVILVAYADVEDFGSGEFPEEVNDVISDYFSYITESQAEDGDHHPVSGEDQDSDSESDKPDENASKVTMGQSVKKSVVPKEQEEEESSFFQAMCCARSCNFYFDKDEILNTRNELKENEIKCSEHTNHNHLFSMGQLSALAIKEDLVDTKEGEVKKRKNLSIKYHYQGREVCKKFFLFVNFCGVKRFNNLCRSFKINGVSVAHHGNVGKLPKNTTSFEKLSLLQTFFKNFSDVHGLVLPGRLQNISRYDEPNLRILPSSFTKKMVHQEFITNSTEDIPYSTFVRLWNTLFPNVVIQKPRTDLCSECQKNTISLSKLSGLGEKEKLDLLSRSQEHLLKFMKERELYAQLTRRLTHDIPSLGPAKHFSFNGQMHYSFDFAQQIFLPHSPQQIGALYFLTPYKVALFGVACEPLGKFVLYLIPESVSSAGKGSNTVVSLLHHYSETFGVGETNLYLPADNCAGQNKNNFLLQYGIWRTMTGRSNNFKISFLPVGHTKFAPDLYFGVTKRIYRRSEVHSLNQLKERIMQSCENSIIPFIVASESGDLNLQLFDWQSFFKTANASRIPGIKSNYHFESSSEAPGQLKCKKSLEDDFQTCDVFLPDAFADPSLTSLPESIKIEPLSNDRVKYLHDKIREFVEEESRDILCPKPVSALTATSEESCVEPEGSVPVPSSSQSLFKKPGKANAKESLEPKQRQRPRCGYCKEEGHTNRQYNGRFTCPARQRDADQLAGQS